MNENATLAGEWHGPDFAGRKRGRQFQWSTLLWSLVFPRRRQRIAPTVAGLVLIGLAFGIGTAAYNTANNILFITLSLLLACLILSGVLSWLNFRRVGWRLRPPPSLRAGEETAVGLEVRNAKRLLPVYGLAFELRARTAGATARLTLPGRLDPEEERRLEWSFRPRARGVERLELTGVGSMFPFGFMRKTLSVSLRRDVTVWPAAVDYQWTGDAAAVRRTPGPRAARAGEGDDLRALRRYQAGDSHRLIHWKASARRRQLLVRQFAAEGAEGFSLWLQTPAETWPRAEQFELLCGFAATLAEDLFTAGRLAAVAVNGGRRRNVRHLRDVEAFLDEVAAVRPTAEEGEDAGPRREPADVFYRGRNLITFRPEGTRGAAAYVDGKKTAAA
jgi:uncharacterized protein (DUF58 family)